jgi:hypothetical protein
MGEADHDDWNLCGSAKLFRELIDSPSSCPRHHKQMLLLPAFAELQVQLGYPFSPSKLSRPHTHIPQWSYADQLQIQDLVKRKASTDTR